MRRRNLAERIADMALAEPHERALSTIRGYAAGPLDTGYLRGAPAELAGLRTPRTPSLT